MVSTLPDASVLPSQALFRLNGNDLALLRRSISVPA